MARSLTASAEVFVRRDVHRVWDVVSDAEKLDLWADGVRGTRWTSEARGVGATFENDYTYGGRTDRVTYAVVDHAPPRRRTVRATSGPYPFEGTLALEATGGGTCVRHTVTAGADGGCTAILFTVLSPVLRMMMRRRLRAELERLRGVLESR
jgi:hypothetical protein